MVARHLSICDMTNDDSGTCDTRAFDFITPKRTPGPIRTDSLTVLEPTMLKCVSQARMSTGRTYTVVLLDDQDVCSFRYIYLLLFMI